MMRIALVALIALAAPALPALAQQPNDGFKELVDKGLEAYNQKRYEDAIKTFEQAYAVRPEPELIYNIARAYEKSLRRSEAIAAYDKFVNLPGTTADLRTKALSAMEALRAEQAALDRAKAPPPRPDTVAASDPPPAANPKQPVGASTTVAPASGGAPVLPWALVGVGAGGVIVGSIFGVMALSAKGDFDAVDRNQAGAGPQLLALKDDIDRNAMIADISLIAGAGVAAVGVVLLIVDANDRADTAMIAPVIGPGSLGLAGRF